LPTPQPIQNSSFTPLLVEHEIVNLPSASTLAVIRREAPLRGSPDRTIAVFADPVFEPSDPRVRKAPARATSAPSNAQGLRGSEAIGIKIDLPRLPSTRQEADAILAMVPEGRRMAALGFGATKAAAMNPDLKRYRIVHFATHTVLNDDHPDLSSLVLSLVDEKGNPQSGFLRLRDMYNLQLAAELVVLSACDTALGKEVKGEGLMSMVRGFMYSGTPRVLASLWKIDDEATAELMKEFYKNLLQSGMAPAAALRQAQITQLQKKSRQSPYYWAGFQLQGEWN
jgi:CHAT domain-containing protein